MRPRRPRGRPCRRRRLRRCVRAGAAARPRCDRACARRPSRQRTQPPWPESSRSPKAARLVLRFALPHCAKDMRFLHFSQTKRAPVSRQPGKGSQHQRRASAIERKATQHHDFIGETDAERAEAEFRKQDRQQQEENREVVKAHERLGKLPEPAPTAPRGAESAAPPRPPPPRVGPWLAPRAVRPPLSVVWGAR